MNNETFELPDFRGAQEAPVIVVIGDLEQTDENEFRDTEKKLSSNGFVVLSSYHVQHIEDKSARKAIYKTWMKVATSVLVVNPNSNITELMFEFLQDWFVSTFVGNTFYGYRGKKYYDQIKQDVAIQESCRNVGSIMIAPTIMKF